jgi:cation diffusion facilitator family transporter
VRAGLLYLLISVSVFILKAVAAIRTDSTALFSDAIETLVNVIAAIISMVVLKFISQPRDENHPYGHGKAEFISSAVEGGFVLSAALVIFFEGIRNLIVPRTLTFDQVGLFVSIVATILNFFLAVYLKKASDDRKSVMLNASSVHVMSDVWTTIGMLGALGVTKVTGFTWIDPVIAIMVGGFLVLEGSKLLREAFSGLTDELDPKVLSEITKAFQNQVDKGQAPGLIDLHAVKFIRSGSFHHFDAHLVVPSFWTVEQAHGFMESLEDEVVKIYPFDGEIAFHLDPCGPEDCPTCSLGDCPIRKSSFQKRKTFTPEQLAADKKKLD